MAFSSFLSKPPPTFFVFGDQAYTVPKRDLRHLLDDEAFQSPSPNPLSPMSLFIHRCEIALQHDMARLIDPAKADHARLPGTLADLLSKWRFRSDDTRRCLPLDMALLVAYQVLLFMRHVGPPSSAKDYADAIVVGACTGALAAVAVGCSADLAELVPLGVEAVRVAFRVGLMVERAAREVAPASGTEQSWSMAVSTAEERTLQGLRVFLEQSGSGEGAGTRRSWAHGEQTNGRAKAARMRSYWVSAWTPSSVTVSGPPEALAELVDSDELAVPGVRAAPIPIFGPFHSPSLYTEGDVADLLECLGPTEASKPARLTVISASAGKPPDEAGNFASLMRTAVEDMLQRPLRWDLVLQWVCEHVKTDQRGTPLLDVVPMASSAEQSIAVALRKAKKGPRRPRTLKSHRLESTTVHRVVTEMELMMGDGLYVVTEADLARLDLREAVQGHLVEGKRLCTPSVFADIAMALGNYMVQKLRSRHSKRTFGAPGRPDHTPDYLVTVADMGVSKALVAGDNGPGSQLLQCHAQADWPTQSARCKFAVVSPSGKPQQHAECTVRITDGSVRALLSQYSSGESHRMNVSSLRARAGTTRISGDMAYRLVSSLADFHRNHRLVRSLVLDPRTHEIAAVVGFPADLASHGDFTANPAVVDAFTQPAGFCLNLDDATDLAHTVYINHGWDEMFLFEAIDIKQEYTVYVRMQQVDRTRKWVGDIIVLQEDNIVAAFLQYSVHAFPRRVFSSLLSQETRTASALAPRSPQTAATSPGTPQTAVLWSPMQTPKPRTMALSIETKGERAGPGVFPPSPVSPDDLSRKWPSSSSAQSQSAPRSRKSEDSSSTAEARSEEASPATSKNGIVVTPWSFDDLPSTADRGAQDIPIPPCKSVVLQGFPKTAHTLLFLLPDGSGSAASYASLPHVGRDVCVIGLVCPFLRGDTAAMARVPLDRLLGEGYLPEILRRQPPSSRRGYVLGGWSAGGSLAFRAAQMLRERGCRVAGLVLIDAPVPLDGMDRLPKHFFEYCESLGILGGWGEGKVGGGGGAVPAWLIPHFEGTIGVLEKYCATPLAKSPGEELRVDVIWAGESVVDRPGAPPLPPHPDDTEGMKFLTVQRTDFGPNGWAELLPGAEIVCHKVDGAHHFSLMRQPFVSQLASFVAEGLQAVANPVYMDSARPVSDASCSRSEGYSHGLTC
ncbi:polyketide synthase [Colletotrichum truncatum]|uniref:Polyketide synthase n=1 Tax=Colletotrichum truncatum TaxID=5467 RepID=A0ACC3YGW3_COLTU|nr:polyketide synthase [Colletotrichum truncatum]KAF6784098.1 polyketide synthase [Colletotrichum truncatum]